MALAAYRHLLRATRISFHEDYRVLSAARVQARTQFEQSRSLEPRSTQALKAIEHAEGVAEVLTRNVVQGRAKNDAPETLKLRIHELTERGDNDTINNPRVPGGKIKIAGA